MALEPLAPFARIHRFHELVSSGQFSKAALRRVLRVVIMARQQSVPLLVTVALRNKMKEAEVAVNAHGQVQVVQLVAPRYLISDPLDQLQCSHCGAPCTATCSGCQLAAYCNASCQRADRAAHKVWCKTARALPEGTASYAFKTPRKLAEVLGQRSNVEACMTSHLQKQQKSCADE